MEKRAGNASSLLALAYTAFLWVYRGKHYGFFNCNSFTLELTPHFR